jgi:citrate lyase subunit beta/citryl-CoA lyase
MDQIVIKRDFSVRRSELTCPGHSLKMATRAAASAADEVILDLEDACGLSQKVAARKTVIEALTTLDWKGKLRAFRPNCLSTKFFYRDLIEVVEAAGPFLDVVVVPKVHRAHDVAFVDRLLTQIEQNMGFPVGRIRIEVLIESAQAVIHAYEIATSSPRLASLIFGIADYAGDIGAKELTKEQFSVYHYPKAKIVAAARAAGLDVIDNVTLQFRDLEQCRRDSEQAAQLGFDGKWAIHPDQLPIINTAFSPTVEEIERAREILALYRKADLDEGLGAVVYKDEMVDAATLRVERKKLLIAKKAGLISDDIDRIGSDPDPDPHGAP